MEEKNAVAENVPTFLKKLRRLLLDIVIVCIKVLIFYCQRDKVSWVELLLYQSATLRYCVRKFQISFAYFSLVLWVNGDSLLNVDMHDEWSVATEA